MLLNEEKEQRQSSVVTMARSVCNLERKHGSKSRQENQRCLKSAVCEYNQWYYQFGATTHMESYNK